VSLAGRAAEASSSFLDRIRHPRAGQAEVSAEGGFDSLRGHKYALVHTFRRSGEAVPTPVWFGLAGGRLYFRSYANAAKLKRLSANPRVLVAPCTVRGKPKGPFIEARARVLSADEEAAAERAIQSNYGLFRRLYEGGFAMKAEGAYVEVDPRGSQQAEGA
jgi:PPOX class probable F420-dependent enzyme